MKKISVRRLAARAEKLPIYIIFAVLCFAVIYPVLLMVQLSLQDRIELSKTFSPINSLTGFSKPDQIPLFPTLKNYRTLMFYTPEFYTVFWNSLKNVTVILACQLLVAAPSAWAFARYRFKGHKQLFNVYVIFMLMPFQVTMLSQYLLLDTLKLMDTSMALILPAVFSTFPVFIMYRSFTGIPEEVLNSARIDGAGEWQIFFRIGIPMGSPGILAAMTLGFLDLWNMVEQPLAFIKDKKLFPLSIFLPMLGNGSEGMVLAASAVTLMPAAFVFIIGQDKLEAGIIASAIKE